MLTSEQINVILEQGKGKTTLEQEEVQLANALSEVPNFALLEANVIDILGQQGPGGVAAVLSVAMWYGYQIGKEEFGGGTKQPQQLN